MTPEEKAEELFGIYLLHTGNQTFAKNCSLIAVDEMIYQWVLIDTYLGDGQGLLNPNLKYWQEVKKELEKL
jgi:hypothetical protein